MSPRLGWATLTELPCSKASESLDWASSIACLASSICLSTDWVSSTSAFKCSLACVMDACKSIFFLASWRYLCDALVRAFEECWPSSYGVAEGFSASNSSMAWMSAGRSPLRPSSRVSRESSARGGGLGLNPAACRASCVAGPRSAQRSLRTLRKPLGWESSGLALLGLSSLCNCDCVGGLGPGGGGTPGHFLPHALHRGWDGTCEAQHQLLHPFPLQT